MKFASPEGLVSAAALFFVLTTASTARLGERYSISFEDAQKDVCLSDGQGFGSWVSVFAGYGCTSVTTSNGSEVLSIRPKAPVSPSDTHSGLVVGPSASGELAIEATLRTARQLRAGGSPNPWEVAWLVWDYVDNDHFYYFIPKPNGWELGKKDPAYPGGQRFLATGTTPRFPIGRDYRVRVVQHEGDGIHVQVNGYPIVSFVDRKDPYSEGKIGFYCEDSSAYFSEPSKSG